MDTGTKAASIQVYDVAAALLFRVASRVFDALGKRAVDPVLKQPGYQTWLELRSIAGRIARERELPSIVTVETELGRRLVAAHVYAYSAQCLFTLRSGEMAVRHFELCDCDFAKLCQSAKELIENPAGALILNPPQ